MRPPARPPADRVGFTPATTGARRHQGRRRRHRRRHRQVRDVQRRRSTGIAYTTQAGQPAARAHAWRAGSRPTPRTGGKLFGFGNKHDHATPRSTTARSTWTTPAGSSSASTAGAVQTVTSPATYRNNAWHHVVATLGPTGMKLYVDGALVGQNATASTARRLLGLLADRWRQPEQLAVEADQQLLQGQPRRGGALPP